MENFRGLYSKIPSESQKNREGNAVDSHNVNAYIPPELRLLDHHFSERNT